MRRLAVSLVFAVIMLLIAAPPAQAWFGWLDELSGPAALKGIQIEVRVFCFNPNPPPSVSAPQRTVVGGRLSLCAREDDANRRWSLDAATRFYWRSAHGPDPNAWAGGNRIRFTTLTTGLTFRPFAPMQQSKLKWADWVDLGADGGVYWIRSSQEFEGGIDSFHGIILDGRFELHMPSHIRDTSRWWNLVPYIRLAGVVFPSGFEMNAFGPKLTGDKAKAIGADVVPELSVFWDLGVLFR